MRIGVALLVIADLCIRLTDLEAHYTDKGVWPTELIHNFGWNKGYWSLHSLNGSYTFGLCLFILHLGSAICLLAGYRTRLATLLVWLMTISLHNRNLFVLQAGDDLLRLVLLWGLFLPWQAYYSVDAWRKPLSIKQHIPAGIGYFLLLSSVYFFAAVLKTSTQWHSEGSAVYYALSLEQLRLPGGDWLYRFPGLMKAATWFVLGSEFLIAPLVLLPSRTGRLRGIAFLLLLMLHLGIGLTLYVGLFFLIGIVSATGLLPSFVMDKIDRLLRASSRPAPLHAKKSRLLNRLSAAFCGVLIFLCMSLNLGTVNWFPLELRDELAITSNVLRLNQYWGMFSPGVLQKDGWFVYHGRDSIGRQWDLRRNEDYVDYEKPARIVSMYKNDRWRKLAENMQSDRYTFLRPLYCKYLIRRWNSMHPRKKMASLSVFFMEKQNLPDYRTTAPDKILHCICYAD